jgi:hypothetical protein
MCLSFGLDTFSDRNINMNKEHIFKNVMDKMGDRLS